MRSLVDDGFRVLTGTGSLAPFGELLHQSWMLKRELDAAVSSPQIDRWYRDGIDAGAIGGKLLGAGAGGFLLFFAPPETHGFIRSRLANLTEVSFHLDAPGSRVIFDNSTAERAPPVQLHEEQEETAPPASPSPRPKLRLWQEVG
jgi:D-glycero-alpha-D-manno-heptose-7-phosphate kinase